MINLEFPDLKNIILVTNKKGILGETRVVEKDKSGRQFLYDIKTIKNIPLKVENNFLKIDRGTEVYFYNLDKAKECLGITEKGTFDILLESCTTVIIGIEHFIKHFDKLINIYEPYTSHNFSKNYEEELKNGLTEEQFLLFKIKNEL